MRRWVDADHWLFVAAWRFLANDWVLRVAIALALLSLLFFARFAFAQTPADLQRQIERLDRQLEQLRQSDTEQQKVRQGGFERLAALETAQQIMTIQIARMENFLYGAMAGLIANLLTSLKALGDIRSLQKGER